MGYEWYITPEEYAIAEKNGISRDTLEHRIRYHAWDKDKAINTPLIKNTEFGKWREIAKKNGIKEKTFKNRVYILKWSYEKAATTVKDGRKKYPEWALKKAKENNIKYYTFLKRIENGWDIERACTEKCWETSESIKKARATQREMNLGPFRSINAFWKLKKKEVKRWEIKKKGIAR